MGNFRYRRLSISRKARRGATIFELLIYVSIFVVIIGSIAGILFGILRIQTASTSAREVSEQGRFVLQAIQREVADSSLIDTATNTSVSVLVIRHQDSNRDYVSFFASGTAIWMAEGRTEEIPPAGSGIYRIATTTTNRLTNENIIVSSSSLSFRRIHNPPAKDAVQVNFTLSFNSDKPQSAFSKAFETTIARVSAAVFNSDIVPGADDTYSVGLGFPSRWKDGFFSGRLGVGITNVADFAGPAEKLHIGNGSAAANIKLQSSGAGSYIEFDSTGVDMRIGHQNNVDRFQIWNASDATKITTFLSNGAVGIGTTTPATLLDVAGSITSRNQLAINYGGGTTAIANIGAMDDIGSGLPTGTDLLIKSRVSGSGIGFEPNNSNAAALYIKSNGTVGIGTTTPNEKLVVSGNIYATGDISCGGSCGGGASVPAVKVKRTSDQSTESGSTIEINWDGEDYDTDNMHSNSTNNPRITINTPGKYLICVTVRWVSNSNGKRFVAIEKNDSPNIARDRRGAADETEQTLCVMDQAISGDFYDVEVNQNTGGPLNVYSAETTNFAAARISQ